METNRRYSTRINEIRKSDTPKTSGYYILTTKYTMRQFTAYIRLHDRVQLYLRSDPCSDRARGFYARVSLRPLRGHPRGPDDNPTARDSLTESSSSPRGHHTAFQQHKDIIEWATGTAQTPVARGPRPRRSARGVLFGRRLAPQSARARVSV